jgi:hypothetical protein
MTPGAWDNGGEPVEFDHDGGEYRAYGTVSAEGDARVKRVEFYLIPDQDGREWQQVIGFEPLNSLARTALERAWWAQLDWREKRKIMNMEG